MHRVSKNKPYYPKLRFKFVIIQMKENNILDKQIEKLKKSNAINWF